MALTGSLVGTLAAMLRLAFIALCAVSIAHAADFPSKPVRFITGAAAGSTGDVLGRLPQAGINHFHSGVAQGRGHDLDPAIVTIETKLGQYHTDVFLAHRLLTFCPTG